MDYTVHGILQARILEWEGIPFSRGSSQPRDQTQVSCITAAAAAKSLQSCPPALQVDSLSAELPGKLCFYQRDPKVKSGGVRLAKNNLWIQTIIENRMTGAGEQ